MENERPLTPEQEMFCVLYTNKGEYSGNGTKSYAKAYGFDLPLRDDGSVDTKSGEYMTCQASASRLLLSDNIKARIKAIYLSWLDNDSVDARLSEILHKGQEANSIQAIKIHNDLKQRITKKVDITTANRPLANLSDEDLLKLASE